MGYNNSDSVDSVISSKWNMGWLEMPRTSHLSGLPEQLLEIWRVHFIPNHVMNNIPLSNFLQLLPFKSQLPPDQAAIFPVLPNLILIQKPTAKSGVGYISHGSTALSSALLIDMVRKDEKIAILGWVSRDKSWCVTWAWSDHAIRRAS